MVDETPAESTRVTVCAAVASNTSNAGRCWAFAGAPVECNVTGKSPATKRLK